jgi:radical SAM superfamily enzyme YgiQ (UPF0313 family)
MHASRENAELLNSAGLLQEDGAAQEERYFRPPSEANSFIIRVMHGCPHNACTFCNLFKKVRFRRIPLEEILAGIDQDAESLDPEFVAYVTSIYLEGGDPPALRVETLLRVMEHAGKRFPSVNRFACYATARFTSRKRQEDLDALGRAGLRRVYVGLESGCDLILEKTRKGCVGAELIRAGELLRKAGIEMDVSIMLGIGGKELSRRHALETAEVINAISPVCVRIRTFTPKIGTDLGADFRDGRFSLMEPHDVLSELYAMVEHITVDTQLLSEHWTNFSWFNARMPGAKSALLRRIRNELERPREAFRPLGLSDRRG